MPRHDYRHCDVIFRDVVRSIEEGAQSRPPACPICGEPMIWIPQTRAMDVGGVKGAAFQAFTTYDGRNQPVRIDSLRKLRQVERESEQMARDGVGQPLVFRRWSQDATNKDAHTLHKSYAGGEQPSPEAVRKFGKPLRAGSEPDAGYGPGVSDENATALPMSGTE